MLESESLDDLAPVRSRCGSSPGAKSKLGRDDKGGGGGSGGAEEPDAASSGVSVLFDKSGFGGASFRGGLEGDAGGGGGAREAKHRVD